MENLNSYRLVDKSEFDEINRLAEEAKQTAKIATTDAIEQQLTKMKDFINNFIANKNNEEDDIENYAYSFGSLFGNLIKTKYDCEWYQIIVDGEEFYCIASPKQRACCICHNYFYSILEGSHNNNFKLLFNMIKKDYPSSWNFMVLS